MDATTANHADRCAPLDVRDQLARLVADAPVSPRDLRPLCPSCSRPTYIANDQTLSWIYVEHRSPIDPDFNCSGSNDPVSYQAYADAVAAATLTTVHAGESTYGRTQSFKSAGLDLTYSDDERDFRHSGWADVRCRVRAALQLSDVKGSRRVAFDHCGSNAWVMKSTEQPNTYRIASSNCHDRFCTPCAVDRAHVIRCNLRTILQDRRPVTHSPKQISHRFLTLTVRTRPGEPLRGTLDDLSKWFKALRNTRLWKSCVDGGAAMLELKWNEIPGRWHPHLHIIIEGDYIPHGALKRVWYEITKTSYICHIQPLRDDEQTIRYVTKYASKPLDGSYSHDQTLLIEAIEALAGRKLVATFGHWCRYALLRRTKSEGWSLTVTYNTLIARATAGDGESQRILDLIRRTRTRLPRDDDPDEPEKPP